jgi:hypothetical protein
VNFMPQPLYPKEIVPNTHCIGGWVGRRAGMDAVDNKKKSVPASSLDIYRCMFPPTPTRLDGVYPRRQKYKISEFQNMQCIL